MTALTKDRNTPMREGDLLSLGAAAAQTLFAGALAIKNATGYAAPGATAVGLIALGRVEEYVDNSAGADGTVDVQIRIGVFKFANSAAADLIAIADIGNACYIVDDQTVAKTDATATRSVAGTIVGVDSDGVWVRIGI